MRIAIVTRYLPPRTDAIGDYVSQLARTLTSRGVEVALVTSPAPGITPIPGVNITPTIGQWGWPGALGLLRTLRRLKVDVVNFQYVPHLYGRYGLNLGAAALPLLMRVGVGAPVVTTCHELLGDAYPGFIGWAFRVAAWMQMRLILLGSSHVVVPAARQEAYLRQRYPQWSHKVSRIPVGTTISVAAPAPAGAALARKAHGAGAVTLGTFGTGHPWWQYETALEIVKAVRARGLNARLLCLGDVEGSHPARYRALRALEAHLGLSGIVEWTGRRPAEEISQGLQAVDIFLALQRCGVTARSTALVAALAHGVPIIATRGPDADEWLLQSGALQVVDPDDLPGAVRAVVGLMSDPQARAGLGRRARDVSQAYCSWEVISDQFLRVVARAQQGRPLPSQSPRSCPPCP